MIEYSWEKALASEQRKKIQGGKFNISRIREYIYFFKSQEKRLKTFHSNDPHDGHGNKKRLYQY